jgi:hypothetical protein
MAEKCNARIKLEQARFFVSQASQAKPDQREALVSNFEAAIVFGRSVTLCLQKDFHDKPSFDSWYAKKQDIMRQAPLFKLFLEKRNYVLKQGGAGIHKAINVEITDTLTLSEFVSVKITRGRPWYRRSVKILWEDLRAAIREAIREWIWKQRMKRKAKRKKPPTSSKISEGFYFDDSDWNKRELFDLFEEYLGKLEQIVVEAEKEFSQES